MADAAIAAKQGASRYSQDEYAHAVLARLRVINSWTLYMDEDEVASRSGTSDNCRWDKAHAVLLIS